MRVRASPELGVLETFVRGFPRFIGAGGAAVIRESYTATGRVRTYSDGLATVSPA